MSKNNAFVVENCGKALYRKNWCGKWDSTFVGKDFRIFLQRNKQIEIKKHHDFFFGQKNPQLQISRHKFVQQFSRIPNKCFLRCVRSIKNRNRLFALFWYQYLSKPSILTLPNLGPLAWLGISARNQGQGGTTNWRIDDNGWRGTPTKCTACDGILEMDLTNGNSKANRQWVSTTIRTEIPTSRDPSVTEILVVLQAPPWGPQPRGKDRSGIRGMGGIVMGIVGAGHLDPNAHTVGSKLAFSPWTALLFVTSSPLGVVWLRVYFLRRPQNMFFYGKLVHKILTPREVVPAKLWWHRFPWQPRG